MIIAKTGMSEVPERCFRCKYYTTNRSICTITGGYYHSTSMAGRPSWCPLEKQPTTNCSQSESAFEVVPWNRGSIVEKTIYTDNCKYEKSNQWVGKFDYDRQTFIIGSVGLGGTILELTPSELRQLADLVDKLLNNERKARNDYCKNRNE